MTTPDNTPSDAHSFPMTTLTPLEQAQDATQQLNNTEFKQFRTWVALDEQSRRERETAAQAGQLILFRQLRDMGVIPTPAPEDEWAQPDGVSRVYLQNDVVTHEDQLWQSSWEGLNTEVPGEGSRWVNITPAEPELEV